MKSILATPILIALLLSTSCDDENAETIECNGGRVQLKDISDSLHILKYIKHDSVTSEWPIKHPVYRLDYGDLDGDGINEIAVGVVKKTRHWNKSKSPK